MTCDQSGEQTRRRRRQFRHLDQHPVTCGQCANERRHGKKNRVVPRHDDAHRTQRLKTYFDSRRPEPGRNPASLRSHPAAQVRQGIGQRGMTREQLEQARFGKRTVAEILTHRIGQRIGVVPQQAIQRPQASRPQLDRRIRLAPCCVLQTGKANLQRVRIIQIVHSFISGASNSIFTV